MDGLTFLSKIMAEMPLPVIVCSEVAHRRTEDAISALQLGAVEVIKKPKLGVRGFLEESKVMFHDVVRSAAQARVLPMPQTVPAPCNSADVVPSLRPIAKESSRHRFGDKIIAVGASTGGTEAIREFLQACP
jgi:two-component system chemotaxis response regulator CheB